jgi:hypothetical protein
VVIVKVKRCLDLKAQKVLFIYVEEMRTNGACDKKSFVL